MNRLSRFSYSLYIVLVLIAFSRPVFAASCSIQDAATNINCFLEFLYKLLLPLAIGVLGIPLVIINGYKIMTSQGDPAKTKEGKEGLTAAVIGIIFLASSLVILNIILNSYGLK